MKLPSKQLRTWLGTWLVVAIVGAALATGSAFAQRPGTSTPSPSSPSVGAGTAASPTPLGNGVVTPTTPPAQTPTGGGPAYGAGGSTAYGAGSAGGGPIGDVPSKQEISAKAFDKLTAGKREFVTRADVAGLPGFDSAFEQADANHDGRLTEDEFNTAWTIYTRQP
jgi:hypothetical protein